jgi:hypothetical protein
MVVFIGDLHCVVCVLLRLFPLCLPREILPRRGDLQPDARLKICCCCEIERRHKAGYLGSAVISSGSKCDLGCC